MEEGYFYFVKDEFYNNLPNCGLMGNKENHGRPCHYCFIDNGLCWMVPISSKVEKYRNIYNYKIEKYGKCDNIRFGYVNGKERAFLIQNCFPITEEFIDEIYTVEKGKVPVKAHKKVSKEVNKCVRKVIKIYKTGHVVFTNIDKIKKYLNSRRSPK